MSALIGMVVLVASCSDSSTDGTIVALPEAVTVFVEFPRYLQVEGTHLEVAVDNQSDADVVFTTLGLDAAGFELLPPEAGDRTVRAGRRVDLQVPFGAVVCTSPRAG